MRVQICSDIHIGISERIEFPKMIEPVAPILALLGDIGDPETKEFNTFLTYCCHNWKQVLLVPGNHEFWRINPGSKKTIDSAYTMLKSFEKQFQNLMVCWRTKFVSEDGVIVLATPLWSRPAEGLIHNEYEVAWVDPDRSFDAETLSKLHEADLQWLKRELQINKKKTVVVLTHYPPSLLLIDRRVIKEADETLYASDLDILIRPPVVAWACGHTHKSIQWTKTWENANGDTGDVLIITNPYGYNHENIYYRNDYVLRIDPKAVTYEVGFLSDMSYKTLE